MSQGTLLLPCRWVGQHIGDFGGDPDSITIFGESAGGASVELQLLSPLSTGDLLKSTRWLVEELKSKVPKIGSFHRAISLSGSSMCFWALNDHVGQSTRKYAELFNCSRQSSREIVDCLRTISASDLMEMQYSTEVDSRVLNRRLLTQFFFLSFSIYRNCTRCCRSIPESI